MLLQEIVFTLDRFWSDRGCLIAPPHDTEVGAGTFYPTTFLRSLGPEPWNVAGIAPSRRPADGRYGDNPYRFQYFYQYQVILKPSPADVQQVYLESLAALGIDADAARGSVRLTLGRTTTDADVDRAVDVVLGAVERVAGAAGARS